MAFYRAPPNLAGPPARYSIAVAEGDPNRRRFEGAVKFRLGHSLGRSYLVPEVLIGVHGTRFFLPSTFGPPYLEFDVVPGLHQLRFDVDVGSPRAREQARIVIYVRSHDRLRVFDDGAQLYRCEFEGPRQITRVATGICRILPDGDYSLRVFHHTTPDFANQIRASGELWSSAWNLAGTRRLQNVAYCYFTSLPRIASEGDLARIAMSSQGRIALQTTSNRVREQTLTLKVYRGDTRGRRAALPFEIPTGVIAPPPLLFHPNVGVTPAYFEVVGPEIVRIGLQPGATLSVRGVEASLTAGDAKRFEYLVLGNASTLAG